MQIPASLPHGDVVPRLADLLSTAGKRWGVRVTQQRLATTTDISIKMVQSLIHGTTKHYDLPALGRLCWYFDCEIDQLLAYLPPGTQACSLPEVQVGRTHLPSPSDLLPHGQLVHTHLPLVLSKPTKVMDVLAATGLTADTVLAVRRGEVTHVARSTLAALCDAAHQRQQEPPVSIHDVLSLKQTA